MMSYVEKLFQNRKTKGLPRERFVLNTYRLEKHLSGIIFPIERACITHTIYLYIDNGKFILIMYRLCLQIS